MNNVCRVCTLSALAVSIPAQAVSISLSAVNPATIQCSAAGLSQSQVLPAGPMLAQSLLGAGQISVTQTTPQFTATAYSRIAWWTYTSPTRAEAWIDWTGAAQGTSTSFADTTPIDVLVTLQATGPVTVNLELEATIVTGAGSSVPLHRVDINNDGSFETAETPGVATFGPFTVDTSPLTVLVRMHAAQVGPGLTRIQRTVRAVPANDLLIASSPGFGCGNEVLAVDPAFHGQGIWFSYSPLDDSALHVAVLGTTIQPIALPSSTGSCLLLPDPQIVLFVPYALPLPAAVRPLGVWIQGVRLGATWETTNLVSLFAW